MSYQIIYFAFVGNTLGGVEQKIIAQADNIYKIKKNFKLIIISNDELDEYFKAEIFKRESYIKSINCNTSRLKNRFSLRIMKIIILDRELNKHDSKNLIVYLRFPLADLFTWIFFFKNKKYTIVTEHQEIENKLKVKKFTKHWLWDMQEFIFGEKVRKNITGFVGVTEEIMEYEKSIAGTNNKFFVTIGNGINTLDYPARSQMFFDENKIKILFIGSGFKPHGLFRLIKSLNIYYKVDNIKQEIVLKIAGNSSEMLKNKKLTSKLKLENKITFLGEVDKNERRLLCNWANVGVGSLAIHKKGLKQTSELKAREYCSIGLPFFWSTSDNDFPEKFPFIFNLPPNDNVFDFHDIIEFVLKMKNNNHSQIMHEFAVKNLDWSIKMNKLVLFFDEVMNDKSRY